MTDPMQVFEEIGETISSLTISTISEERKLILQPLVDFIQGKVQTKQRIQLNFICTHNSRRSHLAQIWAQTLGYFFKVDNLACYSGGTEATALFPKVAETLEKQGFKIEKTTDTENPLYTIAYANKAPYLTIFSKKLDHGFNPKTNFAAVMTCTQADQGCPIVIGAEKRIPITYKDPKAFDNSPQQAQKYEERSLQIATEMYYVFSQINK